MNYRQFKIGDLKQLLEINLWYPPKREHIGFKSNKYILNKVGIYACISSRITTGIHIVNSIKLIITDIMSRTQFHSTKFLILRHAWLNL